MRSGTTFLCNFLNSQSEIICFADSFRSIFKTGKELGLNDLNASMSVQQKNVLYSTLIAESFSLNINLKDFLNKEDFNTLIGLFFNCLEALPQIVDSESDKIVLGVKQTGEEFYIEQLLRNGVKVIYMYRDPRDVLISASNRFGNYNMVEFYARWKRAVKNALNFANDSNFLMVSYETMMHYPEKEVGRLSTFLEIPLATRLSDLKHRNVAGFKDNSSFGDIKSIFDTSGCFRWRDSKQLEAYYPQFEDEALLKDLGYELGIIPEESKRLLKIEKYKGTLKTLFKRGIQNLFK